jgi:hypothetical protein
VSNFGKGLREAGNIQSLNYLIIETCCLHLFHIPGQTACRKYCFLAIFMKPDKRENMVSCIHACTSKIALEKQNMFQSELFKSITCWEAKLLS